MSIWISLLGRSAGIVMTGFAILSAPAQTLQLGSAVDSSAESPSGGGGDSVEPIISPDGRYVLFASTANNLVATTNGTALSWPNPARQNVFLRDRAAGATTLISVNVSGTGGGNGDSFARGVSTNGAYVLFESVAADLTASDTNRLNDVFLRNVAGGSTLLVSVNTNGQAGNASSQNAAMSPDGRYVTFVSLANDLVPSDTNGITDIFVRDMQAGTTVLASVGALSLSKTLSQGSSENPAVSSDGRYVAFLSTATNLVPRVPAGGDVYIRDLSNGSNIWASAGARVFTQTTLKTTNVTCYNLALSAGGQFAAYEASSNTVASSTVGLIFRYNLLTGVTDLVHTNAAVQPGASLDCHSLDITPDGRFVTFIANANGVSGATTCVYVWDAATGTNVLASGNPAGEVATNSTCDWPAIDSSGRFVAFLSSAPDLVTNASAGEFHLFVRDLQLGTTTLVDVDTNSIGSGISAVTSPQLSADGLYVAFECADGNLVTGDRNRRNDVFVRDMAQGRTELVSPRHLDLPSSSANGPISGSPPSLSRDGRWAAFCSDASNLVSGDTNSCRDVFVRNELSGTTTVVSVDTNGLTGSGLSTEAVISGDGRYVAFASQADNLAPGDTNGVFDVFIRDLWNQSTALVSVDTSQLASGNRASYAPQISADGRFVTFRSLAGNLAAGTFTGENLFVRDLLSAKTYPLTQKGVYFAAQTADGRFVSYIDMNGTASGKLYVRDVYAATVLYTNGSLGISSGASSPFADRVVYWAGSGVSSLFATDLLLNTNWIIASGIVPGGHPSLRFDGNGRTLAYTAVLNGTNQLFLYDFLTSSNTLVSQAHDLSGPGDGDSDSAEISADGRFIVYRSAATNLVLGDINRAPDIFLYDALSGQNTLLSTSSKGGFPDSRSLLPVFSGDGRTICFQSWASDLVEQDFNQASDLFVYSLLYAELTSATAPADGALVSWPAAATRNYRVEFTDSLPGSSWQELTGTITRSGNKAFLRDPKPASARFYRVRAF